MPTYRNLVQRAKEIDYMLDELHSQQKKEEVQGTFPVSSRPKGKGEKEVSSHFQHVDMAFDLAGKQITRSLGEEIAAAAQLLLNLSPLPDGYLYLATYRRAFLERYGEYREIPLLELLDSQIGLGLPAHYVDRQASITKEKKPQSVREQVLLNLALTALRDRQSILHLDEKTFLSLEPSHLALETAPPSLDIYVLLATSSLTALNKGQFHLIIGPNGGTQQAGRTLARFSNLLGAEATEALRRTASTEEALTPGSIWAELVYMPRDSRLANVLLRPNTRRYEILYGVSKGTSSAQIIPLKEIVIGVRNKRFYARWTAKQCDLIVSSGHMLDPLQAPAIARFLSDLSQDQTPQLRQFHWGRQKDFHFSLAFKQDVLSCAWLSGVYILHFI
ncbi:hypothetical protein EPA93_45905 [Ktedonosporobacter rubrisoli]|uniref:Lantibiotic dehydratase N-terminal domain-containing protein n=1 Tax=Ktedonosporobacter rubrisoli TaxID=2509675 RepID=A0A4P6K4M4_KTERU|nr:lantibiotic dehydratase [Ktedonosporobacter rubrisoli]QBD82912.1 hypothetical protein EPA93_45905 [Ktedonosporobacter rubrisoli]